MVLGLKVLVMVGAAGFPMAVSLSVAELLLGAGSVVPDGTATSAVLVSAPVVPAPTVPVTVIVSVSPTLSAPVVKLTLLPLLLLVPQLDVPDATHVTELTAMATGTLSVTVAPVTLLGPALLTTRL